MEKITFDAVIIGAIIGAVPSLMMVLVTIWQGHQKGRVKLTARVRREGPLVILKVTNKSEFPVWIARINGRLPNGKSCVPWICLGPKVGERIELKEIKPRQQRYIGVMVEDISEEDKTIRMIEIETQCGHTTKTKMKVNYTL